MTMTDDDWRRLDEYVRRRSWPGWEWVLWPAVIGFWIGYMVGGRH